MLIEMNSVERRVLETIDMEGMMDFIGRLVATPSFGGHETPAQELMAKSLGELGFQVDVWDIDFERLRGHPDFSMSIPREEGLGVVGTLKGIGEDRSLILSGHIDTVAPGDEGNWDYPALEATVDAGRLYGRGVTDMKGGMACALYAVKAIQDAGVKLRGDIIYQSFIGEEDGSPGALDTCLRGYTADAGIVMEPSENKIAPEVAGAISFKVSVPGKSVHACVREEGISAIDKFIYLYDGLRELEKTRNSDIDNPLYSRYSTPFALSIGVVKGGQWPGSVAENLTFEGRIGVKIGENGEDAKKSLDDKIEELADNDPWLKENRPVVEWNGYDFAYSKVELDHPIIETLGTAYNDATGKEPVYEGMTYASDARHLMNIGKTPTTVFGPGDIRTAHGPNEYVPIVELEATVKTLALTIMRFIGYHE